MLWRVERRRSTKGNDNALLPQKSSCGVSFMHYAGANVITRRFPLGPDLWKTLGLWVVRVHNR
jgi:hypothetical protein